MCTQLGVYEFSMVPNLQTELIHFSGFLFGPVLVIEYAVSSLKPQFKTPSRMFMENVLHV